MKDYAEFELDGLIVKSDAHQWMVCERKGGRWIPVTFHITLESTFKSVRERKLRESGVSSAQEFLLALSRENQKLVDAITERSKNADSE